MGILHHLPLVQEWFRLSADVLCYYTKYLQLFLTALLTAAGKPGWKHHDQQTPLLKSLGSCSACHLMKY